MKGELTIAVIPVNIKALSFILRNVLILHYPIKNYRCCTGGPLLIIGDNYPYMLRVNMTGDLAHLQLSDLQGKTGPICRTSDLQGERMLICGT